MNTETLREWFLKAVKAIKHGKYFLGGILALALIAACSASVAMGQEEPPPDQQAPGGLPPDDGPGGGAPDGGSGGPPGDMESSGGPPPDMEASDAPADDSANGSPAIGKTDSSTADRGGGNSPSDRNASTSPSDRKSGVFPANNKPDGKPPTRSSEDNSSSYELSGILTVSNASKTFTGQRYFSTNMNVSGVCVLSEGKLILENPTVITSGHTSSEEKSSFFGLNAGVLAAKGGKITLVGGTIQTSGKGANGLFATGRGSSASMTGGTILTSGDAAHGAMATAGGSLALTNVTITTSRTRAAAIATDRGGGTVYVSGGTLITHGTTSPGIYSTGNISVSDAKISATGSEAAVIEGKNSIVLTHCTLTGAAKCGAMIYQSFSGDAEGRKGTFTMRGGTFKAAVGPLFYVANSTGVIELAGVEVNAASGILVNASAGRWGKSGNNGGHAIFIADGENLSGDLMCDNVSSISATLRKGTTLTGAIQGASLTLDESSTWVVTKDSHLTSLANPKGISGATMTNINGNGHVVRYDASLSANQWLAGKTYDLANSGQLLPK